jgi:hypothetical protein
MPDKRCTAWAMRTISMASSREPGGVLIRVLVKYWQGKRDEKTLKLVGLALAVNVTTLPDGFRHSQGNPS